MTKYDHKQTSPLHLILFALGVLLVAAAWFSRANRAEAMILIGCALLMILAALCFGYLEVRAEGDFLALRYGPLPVFRRRLPFAMIVTAEPGRSSVLDGWGIHHIPGRGTTYNLWGFDCVKLKLGGRTLRIGSDDVQGLSRFLKEKIAARGSAQN